MRVVQRVDAHVHFYPPEVSRNSAAWAAARDEEHWAVMCTRQRQDGLPVQLFPSKAGLLRDMDQAGVDSVVLVGWYWNHHATCVEQNRFFARCIAEHPDRFAAFATVQASAGPAALEEIRWAAERGFLGLGELSPHSQHVETTSPVWREMMQLAGELHLLVNLHVTEPGSLPYRGRVETSLDDFSELVRAFPKTKFILAHWGGGLAFDREFAALPNVFFDTAATPLLYGTEAWKRGRAAVMAGKVLFGSDYPLRLYPRMFTGAGWKVFVDEAAAGVTDDASRVVFFSGGFSQLLRWD